MQLGLCNTQLNGWVVLPGWVNREILAVPSHLTPAHSISAYSPFVPSFKHLLPITSPYHFPETKLVLMQPPAVTQPAIRALFAGKQSVFVFSSFVLFHWGKTPSFHVSLALSLSAAVMVGPACLSLHSGPALTPCLPVQAKGTHHIRYEQVCRGTDHHILTMLLVLQTPLWCLGCSSRSV